MELLGGMVALQAVKAAGAGVVWLLTVVVLWRLAKCLKQAHRIMVLNRVCEKCGRRHVNPDAKFCRDCGGKILKAA